jgi:DNA invertase Pin-like site-specific DNA recombinase
VKVAFYIRVSTSDQTTDNQLRELQQVAQSRGWSVVHVYKDEAISGAKRREQRPALNEMMNAASRREFDLVAAWSVDRLGRSLSDLLRTADDLRALEIELYVHKQAVDTTTPTGRLTYQILGAVSEWEREMINERVRAGMARAQAAGVKFGRPKTIPLNVPDDVVQARTEGFSLQEIATKLNVSKSTVARLVKQKMGWLE